MLEPRLQMPKPAFPGSTERISRKVTWLSSLVHCGVAQCFPRNARDPFMILEPLPHLRAGARVLHGGGAPRVGERIWIGSCQIPAGQPGVRQRGGEFSPTLEPPRRRNDRWRQRDHFARLRHSHGEIQVFKKLMLNANSISSSVEAKPAMK
jgi:hypothetical protein